jgi:diguanylate cyclase (GGDEF)-like protein/PAS domain S-box-containing protein
MRGGEDSLTSTLDTISPARARHASEEASKSPFDAIGIIQAYPGPALLIAPDGVVLSVNSQAGDLAAAMREGVLEDLPDSVSDVLRSGKSMTELITLPQSAGGAALDLTIVPADTKGGSVTSVMILGRNVSLENNLRNALVESRQRYKDLVDCSSDFAWETGTDGRFVFVSPGGVLGFHPDQLVGRPARDFVVQDLERAPVLPFESDQPTADTVVWMRSAGNGTACLEISSLPLFDPDGNWSGARGVSRDVTAIRAKDLALAVARRREQTLDSILRAMRNELVSSDMLDAATRAIVDALDLSACWILRFDTNDKPYVAVTRPESAVAPESVLATLQSIADGGNDGTPKLTQVDGMMIAASQYAHSVNGGVAVVRAHGDDWNDDDRDLMFGVAGQLGLAIEQASNHEQLERLSRTDSLTGLLNRRAFVDEVGRRISLAKRNQRRAALLYIDLDNFKAINDTLGHGLGDDALLLVSEHLTESSRASDVLARLGGDEFALWLDDADHNGGETKARTLSDADALSAKIPSVENYPFALSIGVANFDPNTGETLDCLMERADRAMYIAKRARGVSSYEISTVSADTAEGNERE